MWSKLRARILQPAATCGESGARLGELLNRDQYRRTRFNELLGQGLGISGEQRGLASGIEGIYGSDAATRLGLTQGIEGINSQDLQNRLGLTQGQDGLLRDSRAARLGSRAVDRAGKRIQACNRAGSIRR